MMRLLVYACLISIIGLIVFEAILIWDALTFPFYDIAILDGIVLLAGIGLLAICASILKGVAASPLGPKGE